MTVNELTDEDKRVWCFMVESEKVNGKIIVPPWLLKKAREIELKLGITIESAKYKTTFKRIISQMVYSSGFGENIKIMSKIDRDKALEDTFTNALDSISSMMKSEAP